VNKKVRAYLAQFILDPEVLQTAVELVDSNATFRSAVYSGHKKGSNLTEHLVKMYKKDHEELLAIRKNTEDLHKKLSKLCPEEKDSACNGS